MSLKLGKLPAREDRRDLQLEDYLIKTPSGALPSPPPTIKGFSGFVPSDGWDMLGNGPDPTVAPGFEGAGDCVWAGADHETRGWNAIRGEVVPFTGRDAIADYSAATGYVIGDDNTDNGTDVRSALGYRRTTGVRDSTGARHKLGAYVALEPGNHEHLRIALQLFDAVAFGIEFPSSAMDQFNAGKVWKVVAGSQIEGGHYVPLVAYEHRTYYVVTWGRIQAVTPGFLTKYCDEAYALLSPEMLDAAGKSVLGLDIDQLQADLTKLGRS